jgi:hypothetical protein
MIHINTVRAVDPGAECCMDGCDKPAVGSIVLGTQENMERLPQCAEHLAAIQRENEKYEARVEAYIGARVVMPAPADHCCHQNTAKHYEDLAGFWRQLVVYRREIREQWTEEQDLNAYMTAHVADLMPLYRDGKMYWGVKGDLYPEEMEVWASVDTAMGNFLTQVSEAMEIDAAIVAPFVNDNTTTMGEAHRALQAMLYKRLKDFPQLSAEEQAGQVLETYYADTDQELRAQLLWNIVEYFKETSIL